ncbi:hypothetical protein B0T16DRAFT_157850 [Cercophora newfieldiana]|uniref:Secreted protein n=1 Tax=Cercophora newfieldiana TaxID=92897 RepID=A0AA40CQZ9_9PEZI|nr:hypothetical protein B0T16DRAFT_157850 [Cercophora newfieldiana]
MGTYISSVCLLLVSVASFHSWRGQSMWLDWEDDYQCSCLMGLVRKEVLPVLGGQCHNNRNTSVKTLYSGTSGGGRESIHPLLVSVQFKPQTSPSIIVGLRHQKQALNTGLYEG